MENMLLEFVKLSPGVALALIIFVYLMKYISSKDSLMQTQFDRIETIHNKTLASIDRNTEAFGKITETIRKCGKDQDHEK